ncbi:MAG: sulfite exporter TauE/SafE family protein, partial [Alphaproteobacteria bacterium]|nr:sulfite exporter TauE/SafE family protein [Alphaproteobacteria bacterium]
VAGAIKGAIGVGLPTTAIAILGAGIDLRAAIPILIAPSLAANIWQIMRGGGLMDLLRRFWLLNATACVGVWLGTVILFQVDSALFPALLGLVVVAYAGMGLFAYAPRVPPQRETALTPFVGLSAGLLTGTTGSLLMPMLVYLQALGLEKDRFIQAAGLSLLIGTIAWAAALAGQGALDAQAMQLSAFALAPTLVGMGIGHWVRNRLSQSLFRKCVYVFLLVLGLNLVRGAVL